MIEKIKEYILDHPIRSTFAVVSSIVYIGVIFGTDINFFGFMIASAFYIGATGSILFMTDNF